MGEGDGDGGVVILTSASSERTPKMALPSADNIRQSPNMGEEKFTVNTQCLIRGKIHGKIMEGPKQLVSLGIRTCIYNLVNRLHVHVHVYT